MKKWLKSVPISQNLRHLRAKKQITICNRAQYKFLEVPIN
jgi:hypothetical protein